MAVLLLAGFASAATVYGEVYEWSSLEKMGNVVVEIDTSPQQTIVAKNGEYSFNVPAGSYRIQAYFVENGRIALVADENVTVEGEGDFILDLIMFPPLDASDLEDLEFNSFDVNEAIFEPEPGTTGYSLELVLGLVVLAVILAGAAWHYYSRPKERVEAEEKPVQEAGPTEEKPVEEGRPQLDKYAQEVVDILQRSGNRLTQKELRDRMNVGEAKVSLIVAELEQLGLVKKIKKGRGNIIVLKT